MLKASLYGLFAAVRSNLQGLGMRYSALSVSQVADEITAARVCCGGCGIIIAVCCESRESHHRLLEF